MNRKLTKRIALTFLTTTLLGFSVGMASPANDSNEMKLELRYFKPDFKFQARTAETSSLGEVNFKDDLGMKDQNSNEYRLWFNKNLRLAYTKFDYSGHNTLTRQIEYDGVTYNIGTDVDSKLNVDYYRLTWFRPITNSPTLSTSWLVDIKGFDFNTEITNGTDKASESFKGALPTFGFSIQGKLSNKLTGYGEISGLPLGKYGKFYDIETGVNYAINKDVAIGAGYRVFNLDVKDGDENGDKAQLKLNGPFFNVVYKF